VSEREEILIPAYRSYGVRLTRRQALAALIRGRRLLMELPGSQVSPIVVFGVRATAVSVTATGGGGGGGRGNPQVPGATGGPGVTRAGAGLPRRCCPTAPGTGHTAGCPLDELGRATS
jgi:hypothetical protein